MASECNFDPELAFHKGVQSSRVRLQTKSTRPKHNQLKPDPITVESDLLNRIEPDCVGFRGYITVIHPYFCF